MKKLWPFWTMLLALLLLLPLGYRQWIVGGPTLATPLRIEMRAHSVNLDPANPEARRFGALHYVGGLALSSGDGNFGGLSGLAWLGQGKMVAVSDRGQLLHWTMVMRGARPVALRDVSIYPLRDGQGRIAQKTERDSEAVLLLPDRQSLLISTERFNRLYRYALASPNGPALGDVLIPQSQGWNSNGGAEALAALPDGRLLVISEDPPASGRGDSSMGIVLAAAGATKADLTFHYHPPAGFRPTDAVRVDDAWLLVLHRHFSLMQGVRADVGLVRIADILAGGNVYPQSLARFSRPLGIDNMEGIALETGAKDYYVWLVSDDNFSPLQRTLLLRFQWAGPPKQKRPESPTASMP